MEKIPGKSIDSGSDAGRASIDAKIAESQRALEEESKRFQRLPEILAEDLRKRDMEQEKVATYGAPELLAIEGRNSPKREDLEQVRSTAVRGPREIKETKPQTASIRHEPATQTAVRAPETPKSQRGSFSEPVRDMLAGAGALGVGAAAIVGIPVFLYGFAGGAIVTMGVGGAVAGACVAGSFLASFIMEISAGLGKKIKGAAKKLAGFIGLGGGKDDGHGKKKGGDHGHGVGAHH